MGEGVHIIRHRKGTSYLGFTRGSSDLSFIEIKINRKQNMVIKTVKVGITDINSEFDAKRLFRSLWYHNDVNKMLW